MKRKGENTKRIVKRSKRNLKWRKKKTYHLVIMTCECGQQKYQLGCNKGVQCINEFRCGLVMMSPFFD
jgi:hypothetical protein